MSQKKFLTSSDIVAVYGISEEALQELVDAGELKALADRGTWKFRREDLEALISSGRLSPTRDLPTVDDIDFDETIGFSEESGGDRVDFLELDEDAMSAGSTVISSSVPSLENDLQLSFTDEPQTPPSSSDVRVFEPGDALVSDSEILVKGTSGEIPAENISSSDVQLVSDEPSFEAVSEQAESDQTEFEQTVLGAASDSSAEETLFETPEADNWLTDGSESLDFAESAEQMTTEIPAEESAVEDQATLMFDAADSGLTLETGDSGLTLDTGDSGLTLDAGDSGLTLETGDSGLSLEVVPDDLAPAAPVAGTQRMEQLEQSEEELDFDSGSGDSGGTRRLAVEEKFAEEHTFSDDPEDHDQTAVIMVEDESGDGDYIGTLSGAIAAGEDVEDLEISDDLEMGPGDEEVEFDDAEDAVLDADDEAFSDEFAGTDDDESYLQPAAKAAPREPSWGAFTSIMVIAAGLLVGTNAWLMWEGIATMWNGGQTSGPASSLISAIAGILG